MKKKISSFIERWGYYGLALLCVGVIVGSAMWTGRMMEKKRENAPAAVDSSQRLADARKETAPPALHPPTDGKIQRGFSEEVVWDEAFGAWYVHPAVDFFVSPGQPVYAMAAGWAEMAGEALLIIHENGACTCYRGLAEIIVSEGSTVKRGQTVGYAGGLVPLEGERLCIRHEREGQAIDFSGMIEKK